MTIPQNQSTLDRFARILLGGACLIVPSYLPTMPQAAVFFLMIVGLYLMFSGLSGHCVFYKLFGVSTCK